MEEIVTSDGNMPSENTYKWVINDEGYLICNMNGQEYFTIGKDDLIDDDWIIYLLKKEWCDMNDFIPAYFEALSRSGVREQTIITKYWKL